MSTTKNDDQASNATCTGAQAVIRSLEAAGTEIIFGLPGGALLPFYDALLDSPIRHVLMRHEQGAGHAAEGYAQATGRPGVCVATSGPGATNLVTPLADAFMDSVPLVAITGQVSRSVIGKDAFQEADTIGVTLPVTKHNFKVFDPDEIPTVVSEAFHLATSGRPGPVLVDIPKDVQQATTTFSWPASSTHKEVDDIDTAVLDAAVSLILAAKRPVVYAGGGVVKSDASSEVTRLIDLVGAPVVTTLMARGVVPDSHPLCLGMPGMHGSFAAVTAMQRADLLIALGTRFDDRVTGRLDGFAPEARVIHVDIDPIEIGKNRKVDVGIVSDVRAALHRLLERLSRRWPEARGDDLEAWAATVAFWQRNHPLYYERDGRLKPQFVLERLADMTRGDAVVTAGVGQHQMWASQLMPCERPRSFITSGGLGTMGFAVPAALGAKLGRPNERVIAIDGDGCFQMTAQELATAVTERIPFVVAVINNGHLGMVRQWQEMFYESRFSQVELPPDVPDICRLAEAYGAIGFRVEHEDDVDPTLDKALSINDRPVVIDFRVDPHEMCFPIVPAGASNDEILLGPQPAGSAKGGR